MNGDELTENETYLTDKGALLVMGVGHIYDTWARENMEFIFRVFNLRR